MINNLKNIDYEIINEKKVISMSKKLNSIFSSNVDIKKNAYLNWRTNFEINAEGKFVVLGEAYFADAYNLIQQCILDNSDKKADLWIFPILFNITHGIELYLKAINKVFSNLLNIEYNISSDGHKLEELCNVARKRILDYKIKNKNDLSKQMFLAIKIVEKFLQNLYDKTSDITFSRYPLDRDGNDEFYIGLENEVVDLVALKEQTLYVYKMLDFIFCSISDRYN